MRTLPVFLRLEGRRCTVVGGDEPAAAKAATCVRAGAEVILIAPEACREVARMAADGELVHVARPYRDGDLAGAVLAYASTHDPDLIVRLVDEARRERVLLNVIDIPEVGDFLAPAVLERGELVVAVGTGGASPGLSARLRRGLEAQLGPEYASFVAILGAVRRTLGKDQGGAAGRGAVMGALLDSSMLELIRRGDHAGVDALLASLVGPDCSLHRLGLTLPTPEAASWS